MALLKKDLVTILADKHGITKVVTEGILNSLADIAQSEIKKGESFPVPGIGRLSVHKRAARNGRNPLTGEAIKIAAKNVVKVSVSKELRDAAARARMKKS